MMIYKPLQVSDARNLVYPYYLSKIRNYMLFLSVVFFVLSKIASSAGQNFINTLIPPLFIGIIFIALLTLWCIERKDYQRIVFILRKPLPASLWAVSRFAHWTTEQQQLVELGLREWMLLNSRFPRQHLVLPSQQVALLWQVLSEDTEYYHRYCIKAFGKNNALPYQQSSIAADAVIEKEQEKSLAYTWLAESLYRDQYHQTNSIYSVELVASPLYGVPPLFAIDSLIQGETLDWQHLAQHYQDLVQRYWQTEEAVFFHGLTKMRITKGIIPR